MTAIAITPPGGDAAGLSPRAKARLAGLLYLIVIVGGVFAQIFVRDALVVGGDPAATARNILSHELRYRLGFSVEVFYLLCNVPLTLLLYDLFRVVDRKLMVVTAVFSFVGTAIEGVATLAHYAPLILLGKSPALAAFTPAQREAAAYLSIRFFDYGWMIALAFFGCFCILMGYAIVRSRFFPRFVGPLLWIEGVAYLANSFAHFISPPLGARVFSFLFVSGLAEVSFCLTLLIAAVNVPRWKAQAPARAMT
jgi:uncharacterized protein DUF4386